MEEKEINSNELNDTGETAETAETIEIIEQQPAQPPFNWKKEAFEWGQAIIVAFVIAYIIKTFLFTLVLVDGASMENTLHTGDRLFVTRFMYTPKDGDIIVFTPENFPKKPFIKRVIATEGQTIDIDYKTGDVKVDGKVIKEDYIKVRTMRAGNVKFPATVPEGHFFAMGDNRGNSHDSRSSDVGNNDNTMGMVSTKQVMGKALFRLWPFNKLGSLY